jgi:hypothetical protein
MLSNKEIEIAACAADKWPKGYGDKWGLKKSSNGKYIKINITRDGADLY